MDYKTYRVTIAVTVDIEVPPGHDDPAEVAFEKAEDWFTKNAPGVDEYVTVEADDITVETGGYYDDQKYDLWKEEQPD